MDYWLAEFSRKFTLSHTHTYKQQYSRAAEREQMRLMDRFWGTRSRKLGKKLLQNLSEGNGGNEKDGKEWKERSSSSSSLTHSQTPTQTQSEKHTTLRKYPLME